MKTKPKACGNSWARAIDTANKCRLESSELAHLLAEHRRGVPGARKALWEALEWIVYDCAKPVIAWTRARRKVQVISFEELLGPLFVGLGIALKRLAENEHKPGWHNTKARAVQKGRDPIEYFVGEEMGRVRKEQKIIVRNEIVPPPSTNSGRQDRPTKSLLRDVGESYRECLDRHDREMNEVTHSSKLKYETLYPAQPSSLGGEDSGNDSSVAATRCGLKSSSNGTDLDDPEVVQSGSRHNRRSTVRHLPNLAELAVDRQIDLSWPTELMQLLNRSSPEFNAQREQLSNEQRINERVLEMADFGWPAKIIARLARIYVRDHDAEERGGNVTWRKATVSEREVLQRIGAMRKRAMTLVAEDCVRPYYKPPGAGRSRLPDIRLPSTAVRGQKDLCAKDCSRPANVLTSDGRFEQPLVCWPCKYLELCNETLDAYRHHDKRATLNQGMVNVGLYYSAQPANDCRRPLLNDDGEPITLVDQEFPPIEERPDTYLRRDEAHNFPREKRSHLSNRKKGEIGQQIR